jgi:hypothetical protein
MSKAPKAPNKYRNKPTRGFASKKEANRYAELAMLERTDRIGHLVTQVPFELVPRQTVNGFTERPVIYIADFSYVDRDGSLHVEDTKGFRTRDYIIKRKLMLWVHKIRIEEI